MGVRIYSVQCLGYGPSATFYRQLAEFTCGWHLKLDQFSSIVDCLTAICYREQGVEQLEAFEDEVTSISLLLERNTRHEGGVCYEYVKLKVKNNFKNGFLFIITIWI